MTRRFRPGRRIITLACVAICVLDLVIQAALAVTRHAGLYGGPVVPATGLTAGILYLCAIRGRS